MTSEQMKQNMAFLNAFNAQYDAKDMIESSEHFDTYGNDDLAVDTENSEHV